VPKYEVYFSVTLHGSRVIEAKDSEEAAKKVEDGMDPWELLDDEDNIDYGGVEVDEVEECD